MNSKIIITTVFFAFTLLPTLVDAAQNYVIINASSCTDSEANCQLSSVQSQNSVTESQAGHANAVRFIETVNSNSSAITSPNSIDNVTVYIDRFESANPGGQTITLQVRRPSDNIAATCTLSPKLTNDSTYDGCVVTALITGSSTPESDAEGLTISYRVQALGNANTFYLDHVYVNITYTDSSGPIVILDSPANNTWTNTSSTTFQFTPNDTTSGISSCTLVLNDVLNQTNSSITEGQANFVTSSLNEGINRWSVNCTDTSANSNVGTNTSVRTRNVDFTRPNIQLNLPSNSSVILSENITFNFTVTDNLSPTTSCSIYLDNTFNQTNSSVSNNTLTNFAINGITQGIHNWNITCSDLSGTSNSTETRTFTVNVTPILTSTSDSPDPIRGENVITITSSGIDDPNNDTLNFYCSETSSTPTSSNTICTGGTTTDTAPPYSLTCTYAVATDDTIHTVNCRAFDGRFYSNVSSTTFTTDSTPPTTTVVSVAGDAAATYYDNANDGWTNMTISGETSMACRWGTSDVVYASMSNDCTVSGTQATCSAVTTTQGLDAYNLYVSCQDSLGNAQNTTQNLDITALVLDWTAPTTSDNSSTTIQVPPYIVAITESDNLDYGIANIQTRFCTDTSGSCTPSTSIDSGETTTFTSANRRVNFLRYNSSDPAGNVQAVQNKTININRLPLFTSASDNATTIRGGGILQVTTHTSDADSSQTLRLFVCNSTSVTTSGCTHTTYCSNTTATVNSSCSFAVETDDTSHTWYAFLYDSLNESAVANHSGNYTTDSTAPTITIINPANTTYSENSVSAQVDLSETANWAGYSLDGAANVSMSNSTPTFWSATISDLTNGAHTLRFYANDSYGNMATATRVFTTDTTLTDTTGPTITIFSPTNTTFTSTSVLLNITLSENGNNAVYSLDGTANVSLGNTSLRNWNATVTMSQAVHNIRFYANDTSTNRNTGNSSVTYFTVDATTPQNSTQGYTPSPVNETIDVTCFALWTDNLGLDSGIVQHNETGTDVNATQIVLSGTSGWTNLTISSTVIDPGTIRCKFYAFDKGGLVNTTTVIIPVADVISPRLENITYTPNATDEIDPNVLINVTADVQDNVSVSRVILQYKQVNASDWINATMSLGSGNKYNASFTPVLGNWSFRIYANDTSNNINTSSITNITVDMDKTWNNVSTLPTIKAIVKDQPRNIQLANLTINNTGDFDLNFTVNSSQTWITFNNTGSNSVNFIVNQSRNASLVNVTANTTGFAVGEHNFNITIYAFTINPSLVSTQTLSGKIVIQNVAGPFFTVTITNYDATVTQGDAGVVLTSTLSNDGTADATGTWLNWTLLSGWTNTTGVLNRFIGFLGVGSTVINNITVSISSSASTGTQTITASANSNENVTGSDSKSVTVSSTTPAPSAPSAPGGGGGGGAPAVTAEQKALLPLLLQTNETFELVRGLNDTFLIKVENPFKNTNFTNVTLSVSGFLAQYIRITPIVIESIGYNKSGFFNITITAPSYLTKGFHDLNFTIRGSLTGALTMIVTERRAATLAVHEVSKQEVNETISQAEKSIQEMLTAGFSSSNVKKLLGQAKKAFEERDYEKAKELADEIELVKNTAFSTYSLIQEVTSNIKSAEDRGLRIDETKNLLNLALVAFEREDYFSAQQRVRDAQLVYAIETTGKVNYVKLLMDYWWAVIISVAAASIAGMIVYRRMIVVIIARQLKDMQVEEANIMELMKEAQRRIYIEKTMSSLEYQKTIYEYEKRLSEIKTTREKLRSKRVGVIKISKELDNLKKEDEQILNLMKNLQRAYFEKRAISKPTYARRMEAYKLRRAEVEEALAVLETKLAKKTKLKELEVGVKPKVKKFLEEPKIKLSWDKIKENIKSAFERLKKPKKAEIEKVELKKAEQLPKISFGFFEKVKKLFERKKQVETVEEQSAELVEGVAEKVLKEELKPEVKKKIPKPNLLIEVGKKINGFIGKVGTKVQEKLLELDQAMQRKRTKMQQESIKRKLYSQKQAYRYPTSETKRPNIIFAIKRFIGKLRFKVS